MQSIVKTNISQNVAEQIINLIGKGVFKAGDKLPTEKELMESFKVGRSSIREAMQALSIMGIIDIRPGQGTFIKDISKHTAIRPDILAPLVDKEMTMDLLEARSVIEPAMAKLAAQRATQDDLDAMEELLKQCEEDIKRGDPIYELSAGFHLLVAKASHNLVFTRFVQSIMGLLAARGARIEDYDNFINWEINSHYEIYEAIKNRDMENIEKITLDHLNDSAKSYLKMDEKTT